MKRLTVYLVLVAVATITANAYDFMFNGIAYNINSNNKSVTVTRQNDGSPAYDSLNGILDIPYSVNYLGTTYFVSGIGDNAFLDCDGLTSVTIPNSLISISAEAFAGCKNIKSLNIDNNDFASITFFSDSRLALETLVLGTSVKGIGKNAFYGCAGLKWVNIPNTVTEIGKNAFYGCESLETIVIPNSVTAIDEYAFCGCSSLSSLTIGNSVGEIGKNAFDGCRSLVTLTNLAEEPQEIYDYDNVFESVNYAKCQLLCPAQSENKYKTAPVWKDFFATDVKSSNAQNIGERTDIQEKQATDGKVGIGFNLSMTPLFVEGTNFLNNIGLSAKLQCKFGRVVRGELKIGFDFADAGVSTLNGSFNFHFNLNPKGKTFFYPILGVGVLRASAYESEGEPIALLNCGLGVEFKVAKSLAMGVEACFQYVFEDSFQWRLPVSVGLTYYFPRKNKNASDIKVKKDKATKQHKKSKSENSWDLNGGWD